MRPLSSIAQSCGYTVITSGITFCEITGDGRWHVFSRECLSYVKHSPYSVRDHVTVIIRDNLGHRELHDLGKKGERIGKLPMAGVDYFGRPECRIRGVRKAGGRYIAQVSSGGAHVYLGCFIDMMSAGLARDEYVLSHHLHTPLNFPHMAEVRKEEMEMAVTE